MNRRYLTFAADQGSFLVALEHVREVRALHPPEESDGRVINFEVVHPFGEGRHHLLVLEGSQGPLHLAVGEVTGVVSANPDSFGPAPVGQAHGLILGIAMLGEEPAFVVDVSQVERMTAASGRVTSAEGG